MTTEFPDVPSVLVVCLGNICRSPTAEAALRDAATRAGVDLAVDSAGTGSWHVGSPPDERMRAAAADAGLELDGRASQVDPERLARADLVLAMDASNYTDLRRMAEAADVHTAIHLFREFDPDADDDLEVPDPYQGTDEGFTHVVEICRRTADALVERLAGARG